LIDGRAKWWLMIFFLAGREKNSPGSDFTTKEVEAAKIISHALESVDIEKLDGLVATDILTEICNVKQKSD
jgi:hypothetical protein